MRWRQIGVPTGECGLATLRPNCGQATPPVEVDPALGRQGQKSERAEHGGAERTGLEPAISGVTERKKSSKNRKLGGGRVGSPQREKVPGNHRTH